MTSKATRPSNRGSVRRRSKERFAILNGFVDHGLANLKRSEIAVWLIVFRDSKPNGLARTSLSDLARRGGISRRQASRALQELIGRGVVHVIKKGVVGKATVYSLYPPEALRRINPQLGPWLPTTARTNEEVDTRV